MTHDARHEELLRALLVGEHDPSSPAVREVLQGCPECRSSWEAAQQVTNGLDALARERAEVLDAARRLDDAPGAERAEQALRARIAETRGAARPRARVMPWVLAAAALLLVALGWKLLIVPEAPTPQHDHTLDSRGSNVFTPLGPVSELFPIRWSAPIALREQATLEVETRQGTEAPWEKLYSGPVSDQSWTPGEELRRACRDHIRYKLTLRDDAGNPQPSSGWHEAWLGSR